MPPDPSTWERDGRMVMEALKRLEKVPEQMVEQTQMLKSISQNVETVTHALDGNGKPGLKSRVSKLEELARVHERSAAFRRKVAWAVMTPVIAAIVGIGGGLLWAMFQLLSKLPVKP